MQLGLKQAVVPPTRPSRAVLAGVLAGLGGAASNAAAQGAVAPGRVMAAQAAQVAPRRPTALVLDRVTVIDVEQGRALPDQRVVIGGNRIRALGPRATVPLPAGARVIPARGRYLIPGLWQMHTHEVGVNLRTIPANSYAMRAVHRELIALGFTGVRDPGTPFPIDSFRAWRRAIAAGQRVGPRLIIAAPSVNDSGGWDSVEEAKWGKCTYTVRPMPCHWAHLRYIARVEEAQALVDSAKAAGVDMLKLHSVSEPMWFALAAAARRAGLPFGGHMDYDPLTQSDSGARIFDHGYYGDCVDWVEWPGRRLPGSPPRPAADGILAQSSTDSVPLLARCVAAAARLRHNHTWLAGGDPRSLSGLSLDSLLAHYSLPGMSFMRGQLWYPPTAAERRRLPTGAELIARVPDSVRQGRQCQWARLGSYADIPWMPGPDVGMGTPAPALAHLTLLDGAVCGVQPRWLLKGATLEPARALEATDSLGMVAVGKLADLVLLDGDPLADIWNVTKIAAVMADGRYYDRAALDRLLLEASQDWLTVRDEQAQAQEKSPPAP